MSFAKGFEKSAMKALKNFLYNGPQKELAKDPESKLRMTLRLKEKFPKPERHVKTKERFDRGIRA
jgi:hypothetical protein